MKKNVKGIILIFSCHKHKDNRMLKHKLAKKEYGGYRVYYILGNPNIKNEYIFMVLLKQKMSLNW